MSPLLKDRFATLTAADIVAMKGLEQENRHLDFKLLAKPDFGGDDQRHLAKAVSGFANAEGGVIVWGVDARRDPKDDYIDQVVATPGVVDPRPILSKLNGLSSEATSPGLPGLDHRIIQGANGEPSFVATFVPEGESGPYMAMLGEARHRYYRRIGSAFSPMDHSMVADMFGRRPRGVLRAGFEQIGQPAQTILRVHLRNTGRGPIVAPYVLLARKNIDDFDVPDGAPYGMVRTQRSDDPLSDAGFVGGRDVVIHAGLTFSFVVIERPEVSRNHLIKMDATYRIGGLGIDVQEGSFAYDFHARKFDELIGPAVHGRPSP